MAEASHLLAGGPRLWSEMKGEFEEKAAEIPVDNASVSADDLKKVAKWLTQAITKLGASASVAEEADRDKALRPIADEVIKAYTAAVGTLLSLRRGAGKTLRLELRDAGAGLAAALDALGKAIGSPAMAMNAGKVLDRVRQLERTSTHNRAALRRRILQSLSTLRDAHREFNEALKTEDEDGEDDMDDGFDFDDTLDPAERRIVEALAASCTAMEDALKQASQVCMPSRAPAAEKAGPGIPELEVASANSATGVSAVDGLAVAVTGGLDVKAFEESLAELRSAVGGLCSVSTALGAEAKVADDLQKTLEGVQEAFLAAQKEDAKA
mmetsp:Transcript_145786/g.254348  ORF Transcript_145786/g.254348 Transcript_145786/m.254348 type:complete len:325 (-) Transcript_145786:77-1051(-)